MDKASLISQIIINAQETPYTITETDKGFTLSLDIVDAKWYTLFYKQGLKKTFMVDVALDESSKKATTNDQLYELNWEAGAGGSNPRPHVGARINLQQGEVVSYQSHKEFGASESGDVGKVVDYKFDSREAKEWLNSQLSSAGWSRGMSWQTKVGLWVGIGALVLALGIGVALVIALT